MKAFFNNILFKSEVEEEDYYDDYEDEIEEIEKPSRKTRRNMKEEEGYVQETEKPGRRLFGNKTSAYTEEEPRTTQKMVSDRTAKIVPLREVESSSDFNVTVLKPTSFDDSQEICDLLLEGKAVVVNLEGFDSEIAQQILNFVSGAIYAIDGKVLQISKYNFIFAPKMIEISDECANIVTKGFDIGGIKKF